MNDSPTRKKTLDRCVTLGIAVCAVSMLTLAALQFAMPDNFASGWGVNPRAVNHFSQVLHVHAPKMTVPAFALAFRILLGAAWAGYLVAVIAVFHGGMFRAGRTIVLIVLLAVVIAVIWPSSLSYDVYGYVGYARMHAIYGQNPYFQTPRMLIAHHDPAARFLVWDLRNPYGPVWTDLAILLVWLTKSVGLWWQVATLKLLEAIVLVIAAIVGSRVTSQFSSKKAPLTLLAIGLNPLLLIEGPGNGHNDILMMCLVLAGGLCFLQRKNVSGSLLLGAAIGIKFMPVMILPWLILDRVRGKRTAQKISALAGMLPLVLAPIVLCYAPLWEGMRTFHALGAVATAGAGNALYPSLSSGRSGGVPSFSGVWALIVVYAVLTYWIWIRSKYEARWTLAWTIMSGVLALSSVSRWFPWYLTWPMMMSLVRWDGLHVRATAVCFSLAILFTMLYSFMW